MQNRDKETAIQDERQLKTTQEIIDEIIKLFAENIISISDAKDILEETSKRLCKQPVVVIGEDVKKIYGMRNRGILKA